MADRELVIKIPENTYRQIQALARNGYFEHDICGNSMRRIANGALLPKGHGRLIDVGQCDRKLFYQQCGGSDSLITVKTAFDMLMALPTIIEADKE